MTDQSPVASRILAPDGGYFPVAVCPEMPQGCAVMLPARRPHETIDDWYRRCVVLVNAADEQETSDA